MSTWELPRGYGWAKVGVFGLRVFESLGVSCSSINDSMAPDRTGCDRCALNVSIQGQVHLGASHGLWLGQAGNPETWAFVETGMGLDRTGCGSVT